MPDPIRSRPISTRHPKFCWPWPQIQCATVRNYGPITPRMVDQYLDKRRQQIAALRKPKP